MDIKDMQVGKVYSLTMVSPAIYGLRVVNAYLTAVANVEMARLVAPVDQQYAQIYPSLPNGTRYSVTDCKYYIFKQMNGEMIALADQWIVEGSVELIERVIYKVVVYDGELGDSSRINAALRAIGKSNFTISVD